MSLLGYNGVVLLTIFYLQFNIINLHTVVIQWLAELKGQLRNLFETKCTRCNKEGKTKILNFWLVPLENVINIKTEAAIHSHSINAGIMPAHVIEVGFRPYRFF